MTSKEIRRQFIEFFQLRHGHTFVPSSPVVPQDDPTLLFANAGMNQFKSIFLGQQTRSYTRAVNSQKCIRAGGKHNDLDDVGRSRRHHTFFEMLGNWSFGDYFKQGAIEMAWELLTKVWKMDPSRLHVTCFEGDESAGIPRDTEAAEVWKKVAGLPDSQIHFLGFKDNFWMMGETGPCGPCTEIYLDRTPNKSGGRDVGGDNPLVTEFWNLVFIQYNRLHDGSLEPLPARHVDTGMGFERVCSILQGKSDNYAIDLWQPYFEHLTQLAGKPYTGLFPASDTVADASELSNTQLQIDIAFRAIADHARMASFSVTDGAVPSNKKRGAVLRSVIRRAVRFGYQVLEIKEPFLYTLVPVVAQTMGEAFPEVHDKAEQVAQVIRGEEEAFLSVIDRGLGVFQAAADAARKHPQKVFAGGDLFNLHATLGFPADMAMQLAREQGLTPDTAEYERLWAQHVQISGAGRKHHAQVAVDLSAFVSTDDGPKYQGLTTEADVLGWIREDHAISSGALEEDAHAAVLLDRTTFYAEQGGQVGDIGVIQTSTGRFEVTATHRSGQWVLHEGIVAEGTIQAGQQALVRVNVRRSDTMRNHTATHLLNWALRRVLGNHIDQKGSLVDPDKLRFDFSHDHSMTGEQIVQVERLVNEKICADLPVSVTIMPLEAAQRLKGVRAVFGEKYPDPVRVVAIGTDHPVDESSFEHSIEFCGGTHLSRTGQAGFFKVVAEESVSKGVRRITAVTGRAALDFVQNLESRVRNIAQILSVPIDAAADRIGSMQEQIKTLQKKLQSGGGGVQDPKAFADELLKIQGAIIGQYHGASSEQMLAAIDSIKKRRDSYAVLLAGVNDEKVSFVAAVSDDMIQRGLKAGDWIREVAKVAGGGGGGRPQMAQAGGKDSTKIAEALEKAQHVVAPYYL